MRIFRQLLKPQGKEEEKKGSNGNTEMLIVLGFRSRVKSQKSTRLTCLFDFSLHSLEMDMYIYIYTYLRTPGPWITWFMTQGPNVSEHLSDSTSSPPVGWGKWLSFTIFLHFGKSYIQVFPITLQAMNSCRHLCSGKVES